MAIGSTYYYVIGFLVATLLCHTHYNKYDGNWHRPRNQYKKKREKAASATAVATTSKAHHHYSSDDSEPAARRPRHGSRRAHDGHRDSRVRVPTRRRQQQRSSDRSNRHHHSDSYEGDESHIHSSRTTRTTASTNAAPGHPTKRFRTAPNGPYAREEGILGRRSESPLRPVHTTDERYRGRGHRQPADFAQPDHTRPGRNTRFENDVPFSHLYGAYDDQMHAPFEGS